MEVLTLTSPALRDPPADATYQEDKSLVRTGDAPRVMASLRSLAISLLRLGGYASYPALTSLSPGRQPTGPIAWSTLVP
jgi:hypothetical protein